MPRTIAYKVPPRTTPVDDVPVYGSASPRGESDELAEPDQFQARLIKYIPGETLAFVVPVAAFANDRDGLVALVAIAGAIGQLLLLKKSGGRAQLNARPTPRFFLFALIAYIAWAFGTSAEIRNLIGMDTTTGAVIMATAAYLLPLIDPFAHAKFDTQQAILTR